MPIRGQDPADFGDRLAVQSPHALLFWPRGGIAMIREEHGCRLEVTSVDGEVAHRPGPLDACAGHPLVAAGPGILIHPRHAPKRGAIRRLPGGWRIPAGGPLPRSAPPPPPPEEAVIPGLGVRPAEVICLRHHRRGEVYWITDHGRIRGTRPSHEEAKRHPYLACIHFGVYVNPRRLRALRWEPYSAARHTQARYHVILDGGVEIVVWYNAAGPLREALGLPDLRELAPADAGSRALYREELRDWPFEIPSAPRAVLRRHFGGDERRLIANLIWQVYRQRRAGLERPYGRFHRAFWYRAVVGALARAGFIRMSGRILAGLGPPDPHYRLFETVMATLVGEDRLFDYKAIGFDDPRPEMRAVGAALPHVLLLAEKDTLSEGVEALRARYGCSSLVLAGQSHYEDTEFLVDALRAAGVAGPLMVMAYVDYDPPGWAIPHGFVRHLARYGMEVAATGWLVRPQRFTRPELDRHAIRLGGADASHRGLLRSWMAETGGIDGRPLGLHADLLPVDRVVKAFAAEMRALGKRAEKWGRLPMSSGGR